MSYTVRPRRPHGGQARPVDEPSAEAAAVAYLEDFGHDADEDENGSETVSLIVRDDTTGREQCFRVDLATGQTEACG